MPNVDFTLEDIRFTLEDVRITIAKDVQNIVDSSVAASEKRLMKHMDIRFEETHQATIDLVGTVLDQLDEHTERFDAMDTRFDDMDDRFDRVEGELKTTNRLVRRHSQDIMELRAN